MLLWKLDWHVPIIEVENFGLHVRNAEGSPCLLMQFVVRLLQVGMFLWCISSAMIILLWVVSLLM